MYALMQGGLRMPVAWQSVLSSTRALAGHLQETPGQGSFRWGLTRAEYVGTWVRCGKLSEVGRTEQGRLSSENRWPPLLSSVGDFSLIVKS